MTTKNEFGRIAKSATVKTSDSYLTGDGWAGALAYLLSYRYRLGPRSSLRWYESISIRVI